MNKQTHKIMVEIANCLQLSEHNVQQYEKLTSYFHNVFRFDYVYSMIGQGHIITVSSMRITHGVTRYWSLLKTNNIHESTNLDNLSIYLVDAAGRSIYPPKYEYLIPVTTLGELRWYLISQEKKFETIMKLKYGNEYESVIHNVNHMIDELYNQCRELSS